MDRRLLIVIAVIGLHVLGFWALQAGLLHRAVERVVPVSVLANLIEPTQPQAMPTPLPPQPPNAPPPPQQRQAATPPVAPRAQPVAQPAPLPVALAPSEPAQAPVGATEPQPPTPATPVAVSAAEPAAPLVPPAPPAPPKIEPPSSHAAYLNNRKPPYPRLSNKLGEEGTVMVRARIEPNGTASQALVHRSSGFKRLDDAAVKAVLGWRYVPGKRAGIPEAMWFDLPVTFNLEKNPS